MGHSIHNVDTHTMLYTLSVICPVQWKPGFIREENTSPKCQTPSDVSICPLKSVTKMICSQVETPMRTRSIQMSWIWCINVTKTNTEVKKCRCIKIIIKKKSHYKIWKWIKTIYNIKQQNKIKSNKMTNTIHNYKKRKKKKNLFKIFINTNSFSIILNKYCA